MEKKTTFNFNNYMCKGALNILSVFHAYLFFEHISLIKVCLFQVTISSNDNQTLHNLSTLSYIQHGIILIKKFLV